MGVPIISTESVQENLRKVEQQRDYFARNLREKSQEFVELHGKVKQLKEKLRKKE